MRSSPKNILLTGIPRSGTSLVTKLLSSSDNTVCFSEPAWLKTIRNEQTTPEEFSRNLSNKIECLRDDIKQGNPIELTLKKGTQGLPDNYYIKNKDKIHTVKESKMVHVEYHPDLLFVIKSNTLFTACINALSISDQWDMTAIIRDPLYVLMSWRSLDIPISRGSIKIGELYSEELRGLSDEENLLIKQVKILDWFFKKYQSANVRCMKYEDSIHDPQNQILKHFNQSLTNNQQLVSSNQVKKYPNQNPNEIVQTLHKYGLYFKNYYPSYID